MPYWLIKYDVFAFVTEIGNVVPVVFPPWLSISAFNFSLSIKPSALRDDITATFICSSDCAFSVFSFASAALFNIPFCPVSILTLMPAKIKSTIIVTTSAISVIPLFLLIFVIIFLILSIIN